MRLSIHTPIDPSLKRKLAENIRLSRAKEPSKVDDTASKAPGAKSRKRKDPSTALKKPITQKG